MATWGIRWYIIHWRGQRGKDLLFYQNDDATSVQGIKEQPLADTVNYNLAGQKANASYKGIVIQNGKKVIMK